MKDGPIQMTVWHINIFMGHLKDKHHSKFISYKIYIDWWNNFIFTTVLVSSVMVSKLG